MNHFSIDNSHTWIIVFEASNDEIHEHAVIGWRTCDGSSPVPVYLDHLGQVATASSEKFTWYLRLSVSGTTEASWHALAAESIEPLSNGKKSLAEARRKYVAERKRVATKFQDFYAEAGKRHASGGKS